MQAIGLKSLNECKAVSGHPLSPLRSGDFFECVTYTGVDTPSLQFFAKSFLFWLVRWDIVISVKFYEQDICSVTDFSSQRWGFIVYPILGLISIWRLLVRELSSYKKRNVLDLILLWFAHFFRLFMLICFRSRSDETHNGEEVLGCTGLFEFLRRTASPNY